MSEPRGYRGEGNWALPYELAGFCAIRSAGPRLATERGVDGVESPPPQFLSPRCAMNQADTAWMLISTALVLLMTPALGFFYGGLVRSKNALNTLMMSFISLGFVGVLWALVGYSLAFGPGNDWIGDTSNALLNGVGLDAAPRATNLPHVLYMSYQGTFAIITAALISGAI